MGVANDGVSTDEAGVVSENANIDLDIAATGKNDILHLDGPPDSALVTEFGKIGVPTVGDHAHTASCEDASGNDNSPLIHCTKRSKEPRGEEPDKKSLETLKVHKVAKKQKSPHGTHAKD